MAKVLVTGGAGFIGSHLVDAYIEAGHDVAIVDNLENSSKTYLNPKARFYEVDILDPSVEAIIAKERPAVLNHHAAQASISRSVADPVYDARTNILGSVYLVELGRKYGIRRLIFASSGGAVYGHQTAFPASEDHPLNPVNAYGIGKLTVERYLACYWETYHIRSISFRYANVYGPRQNPEGEAGVIAIFVGALLQGRPPIIYGDGRQTRDFVHVQDVARANVLALDLLLRDDDTAWLVPPALNIGTGRETSVLEIFDQIASIVRGSGARCFEPAREGEIHRSVLATRLASKVLSWAPRITLEEGLRETAAWFSAQNVQLEKK